MKFSFEGAIAPSKSLLIRKKICESFVSDNPGDAEMACDDVRDLTLALRGFFKGENVDCGHAAAVLRFMALRVSRQAGHYVLHGSQRLFERPQTPLLEIFEQLKVKAKLKASSLEIQSDGWIISASPLVVNRKISSQFASAIVLNSWNLSAPLSLQWHDDVVSDGYWQMTLQMVKQMGMHLETSENSLTIRERQIPQLCDFVEPDMSSAFAVAALAAVGGKAFLHHFPEHSLQPDFEFVKLLEKMAVDVDFVADGLSVIGPKTLFPLQANLCEAPDLFPVLAVLCAFADGRSCLSGAPQLIHKESNRIQRIHELLMKLGRKSEPLLDGMIIHGRPFDRESDNIFPIFFDSDKDHRLVMAACVARQAGFNVQIGNPQVVNKSFPKFLEITSLC